MILFGIRVLTDGCILINFYAITLGGDTLWRTLDVLRIVACGVTLHSTISGASSSRNGVRGVRSITMSGRAAGIVINKGVPSNLHDTQ